MKLLVDVVASQRQGTLIFFCRVASVHHTEITGAGTDVDDERIDQGLQTVGHCEGLGNDHQSIDDPPQRVAQLLLVDSQRGGRHAHHCPHS